jgi:hypothetical protein
VDRIAAQRRAGVIFLAGLGSPTTHGWEKAGNAAAVLAFAIWRIRIARTGIFAGPEQVIVRNYFRTYRVGWAEITGFELPRYRPRRQNGLGICLTEGAMIRATLYARAAADRGAHSYPGAGAAAQSASSYSSFLKIWPSFMMSFRVCSGVVSTRMSASGFPSMTSRSATAPAAITPS